MKKTAAKKLHLEIASLLEKTLSGKAKIDYQDNMIKVVVSREDFEDRFSEVLHYIKHLIDEEHPYRSYDVSVLVRDSGFRFEHIFKIWKTL